MRWQVHLSRALMLAGLGIIMGGAAVAAASTQDRIDPQFTLIGPRHHRFTPKDFRGRFLLIYFGYTGCPDQCPLTMASMASAMRLLGPRAALIQPIFITVDPKRDTPKVAGDYARLFSSRMIGLSGGQKAISEAESVFHVYVGIKNSKTSSIPHSSLLYVVGPLGRFRTALSGDLTPEKLARALSKIVGAGTPTDHTK
jgi:protein SCO1/2